MNYLKSESQSLQGQVPDRDKLYAGITLNWTCKCLSIWNDNYADLIITYHGSHWSSWGHIILKHLLKRNKSLRSRMFAQDIRWWNLVLAGCPNYPNYLTEVFQSWSPDFHLPFLSPSFNKSAAVALVPLRIFRLPSLLYCPERTASDKSARVCSPFSNSGSSLFCFFKKPTSLHFILWDTFITALKTRPSENKCYHLCNGVMFKVILFQVSGFLRWKEESY